jgi:hypothetical protein
MVLNWFYISSIIFSLLVFMYYTNLMGLYSRNIKYGTTDKLIIGACFIICFIPILNIIWYGILFLLLVALGLVLINRKYKKYYG